MIDKIEKITMIVFKFGILLIGVVFLVVYYWSSQNGRFQKFSTDEIDIFILDTQTGIIYSHDKGFLSVNFKTGKIEKYDRQIIDKRKLALSAASAPVAAPPPPAPPPPPPPAPAPPAH